MPRTIDAGETEFEVRRGSWRRARATCLRLGAPRGRGEAGGSRRGSRESREAWGEAAPTAPGDGVATPTSMVLRRVSAPVGAERMSAESDVETKTWSVSATGGWPLATTSRRDAGESAGACDGKRGGTRVCVAWVIPIVAVPPPMAIPAHRWVRSARIGRRGVFAAGVGESP